MRIQFAPERNDHDQDYKAVAIDLLLGETATSNSNRRSINRSLSENQLEDTVASGRQWRVLPEGPDRVEVKI